MDNRKFYRNKNYALWLSAAFLALVFCGAVASSVVNGTSWLMPAILLLILLPFAYVRLAEPLWVELREDSLVCRMVYGTRKIPMEVVRQGYFYIDRVGRWCITIRPGGIVVSLSGISFPELTEKLVVKLNGEDVGKAKKVHSVLVLAAIATGLLFAVVNFILKTQQL